MQLLNPLRPYIAEIDACAQSLKLWVLEICAWLVVLMDSRTGRIELRKMMMMARGDLRALIFLKMVARLRFVERGSAHVTPTRPNAAPPGFRYARRSLPAMKVLTRGIRLKTLGDLKRVLATLDAVVDRALARRRWRRVFSHTPPMAQTPHDRRNRTADLWSAYPCRVHARVSGVWRRAGMRSRSCAVLLANTIPQTHVPQRFPPCK